MITVIPGPGITVTNNSTRTYVSPTAKHGGAVHFNSQTLELEIYDGHNWTPIQYSYQIEVDMDVKEVVQWAREKMHEDRRLKELVKTHPGLKEVYEKFEIMKALCLNDNGTR